MYDVQSVLESDTISESKLISFDTAANKVIYLYIEKTLSLQKQQGATAYI
jgi:hypothetical protein